jgi:hypothetical protein
MNLHVFSLPKSRTAAPYKADKQNRQPRIAIVSRMRQA